MLDLVIFVAFAAPILIVGAIVARRRKSVWQRHSSSAVHRQYVYLFKGGHLSESAVQSARVPLEIALLHDDAATIDAAFAPGTRFASCARALAEIGSDGAREALERQLQRTHVADAMQQAWYQLDVARNLRRMNVLPSLAALVRSAAGPEGPLTHFLAAEAASFPGFSGFMHQLDTPLGRDSLRVMHRALNGLRQGVEPRVVAAGRLGEAVELLWDRRYDGIDPLAVRVFAAVDRLCGCIGHTERWFGDDETGRMAFREQADRMTALADGLNEYLAASADILVARLANATLPEQADLLEALVDLRADAAAAVVPLLESNSIAAPATALASLAFTADPKVGSWLCDWILRAAPLGRRAVRGFPHAAALRALRHFPSEAAEWLLLDALDRRGEDLRVAALGSLGWWVPVHPTPVLARLKEARLDRSPAVMTAAQAALARLGERHALRWLRQQLLGEVADPVHRAIQLIGEEGVLLLWPDLDALTDAEDCDIALHAREALELLRENLSFSPASR